MLESSVSVLPTDWFSLSEWPWFQLTHCKSAGKIYNLKHFSCFQTAHILPSSFPGGWDLVYCW